MALLLIAQEVLIELEAKEEELKKDSIDGIKTEKRISTHVLKKNLKQLRISEGKLLVKLISRQTGNLDVRALKKV